MSPQASAIIDRGLRQLREGLDAACIILAAERATENVALRADKLRERVGFEEKLLRARYSRELLHTEKETGSHGRRKPSIRQVDASEDVLVAQLRECQEFARALEEYLRFFSLAKSAEYYKRVRFELYEIEKEAVESLPSRFLKPIPANKAANRPSTNRFSEALVACPLYLIVDESLLSTRDPQKLAFEAASAGVRIMQMRMKHHASDMMLDLAVKLKRICEDRGCLLIINDRLDIARLSGADGVHLGEADIPVSEARRFAPDLILGATVRNPDEAARAEAAGADYLGCGSVYASRTKPGLPILGARGLGRVVSTVQIPVVAIGGIKPSNCANVMKAGARGFCSVTPFRAKINARTLVAEFRAAAGATMQASAGG